MDPVQAKFYQTSFELECGGQTIQLRGLFSETGITRIMVAGSLPDYWRGRVGKLVLVTVDTLKLSGVLLEQRVESGSFFEVRFRSVPDPIRQYLRQRIKADGVAPGWKREFPRIPVDKVPDPSLPVPSLCMIRYEGEEIFVNVLNFTLWGVRVETMGDQLAKVTAGSEFDLDLLTSNGMVMANLTAVVRNMTTHENTVEGRKVQTRSIGLQFRGFSPENEAKYRKLIRDYCLEMIRRLDSK